MRIGVIADTHGRIPSAVLGHLHGVEELWHLGDVTEPATLAVLDQLGVPVTVVRGNCDSCMDWPLTLSLVREGVRFHLEHIPPRHPPPDCDVLLHGHTHVPRDEMIGGVRWLNPGTAGKPNKGAPPSVAVLEAAGGKIVAWNLIRL